MSTTELTTVDVSPVSLLQTAIENRIDADSIERIARLVERFEDRQREQSYNVAMNACQAEIQPVIRKKWNDQNKCHYNADEDIDEAVRDIYIRHGFSLDFGSDVSPIPEHYRCVCDVRHVSGHKERHFLDGPCDDKGLKGNPNKTGVQGVMSTMAYLRRNLKCLIFNIPQKGQDKDGQNGRPEPKAITAEQVATINDWMLQTDTNLARFLKWVSDEVGSKVESLDQMPVTLYAQAIQMFRDKQAQR